MLLATLTNKCKSITNLNLQILSCKIRKIICIVKILRWFILLCPGFLSAQGMYDFEENGLIGWGQAPAARWEISAEIPLNGTFSLHHAYDNPEAGEDIIFRNINYPLPSDTLSFSFGIRHAYNPSRNNNWQFYFLSLLPDQLWNCMVFGVNFTGSDDTLRLWQVLDGDIAEIVNTGISYEDEIGRTLSPHFFITRTPGGEWSVKMDFLGDGSALQVLGSGNEQTFTEGKFLGLRYAYSSAQDRKLWVDDILTEGVFYKDEKAPVLDTVIFTGLNSILLCFDENILLTGSSRFLWKETYPDTLTVTSNEVQLTFPENFPNREVQLLSIHAIEDMEGNLLADTLLEFRQELVEFGEVVFNEIMCDPEPPVYLPACEYVEMLNNSGSSVDLSGFSLLVNSKTYLIPEAVIQAGEYLILSSENSGQFFNGKQVLEILSSASALSNSGAKLGLFDTYSRLIHTVTYREMESYDPLKSEGGWSLECVDPDLECGGLENWKASRHPEGGSPGAPNSVMDDRVDLLPPEITFLGIADTNALFIHFSESVYLSEESGSGFYIQDIGPLEPVLYTSPLVTEVLELVSNMSFTENVLYTVELENIADCEGNKTGRLTLDFRLPKLPSPQMVVINELMYDPLPGSQEYLELYNISDQYLDLRDMKISVNSDTNPNPNPSLSLLSDCSHLIDPNQYVAFTADEQQLRDQWGLNQVIDVVEMVSWRSLPNEHGYLNLLNRSDIIMERLHYHDSLHHDLLMDPGGVALERISAKSTIGNWTSASATVNYGTPGTENSQKSIEVEEGGMVELLPKVISPDLDGHNDLAEIILQGFTVGSYASIYVSDINGYEIITIVENGILGGDDHFFWDGHDGNQHLVLPGIYIVHIRVHGKFGEQIFRKSLAVTYR